MYVMPLPGAFQKAPGNVLTLIMTKQMLEGYKEGEIC